MSRNICLLLVWACVFAAAPPSHAASQEKVFSLREAVEQAMTANPELSAAREGLLARREDIGIAGSFILPRLTFEERFMRTDNPVYVFMSKLNERRFTMQDFAISSLNHPSAVNDFQTSFSFEQPLFAPKAGVGIDMAKKEYASGADEFGRKKEEVAFRVFKAYIGVQTAKAYAAAADRGVEDAREHLRIAEARYNTGLGLISDTLRAKTALSLAEERLVLAEKDVEIAKRGLGLIIGLAESVDVPDERPVLALRALEYYSDLSLERKDLKSLETKYQNAENMLRMAKAGYLPTVGIGGTYQLNDHRGLFGSEGDSWQVAAFLRWELFDGTKREHEIRKAKHTIGETAAYLEGFKKELSYRVYEAYLEVNASRKGVELAKNALDSAEEGRRLVRVRYENSLSPMVDLLDAQASLDASRAMFVGRQGEYLSSIAKLDYQSGTILKELEVEK